MTTETATKKVEDKCPTDKPLKEQLQWIKNKIRKGYKWNGNNFAQLDNQSLQPSGILPSIETLDVSTITPEEFYNKYQRKRRPVLLKNACSIWNWKGMKDWSIPKLLDLMKDVIFDLGDGGRYMFILKKIIVNMYVNLKIMMMHHYISLKHKLIKKYHKY